MNRFQKPLVYGGLIEYDVDEKQGEAHSFGKGGRCRHAGHKYLSQEGDTFTRIRFKMNSNGIECPALANGITKDAHNNGVSLICIQLHAHQKIAIATNAT